MSPNLLAALLPLSDLSLKQCLKPKTMLEVGVALFWEGWVPQGDQGKKECIKYCETCFANTLNLNDKGPNLK